ncbi:putative cell division cycle protein [Cladorrhinum sp. PSN259]|nr:putative cell division cycle protein [Cladorrhinum sp. PSN259]
MPAIESNASRGAESANVNGELSFPPVTRDHILHCSYDAWFPKYRTSCIKSRIIPLSTDFVSYIREDGIVLADECNSSEPDDDDDDDWEPTNPSTDYPAPSRDPKDEAEYSDSEEGEPLPPRLPPNKRFPELHARITSAIAELGGAVAPKLNWSSPRDATWISRYPNTVKCTSANDIYVLLKSSSFISHDLDHAFDDTIPPSPFPTFQPVLVLRAFFNPLPSLEFRCFVKDRNLIAITQRDPNYYAFLNSLRPHILKRIKEFFLKRLKFTFPDACFVFDVYVPEADYDDDEERLARPRLIDINPWAPRTDSILFDWAELLDVRVQRPVLGGALSEADQNQTGEEGEDSWDESEEEEEGEYVPELRIVEKDDPSAYNFSTPAYSAHKMPKEVVDASQAGEGGMREFAEQWRRMQEAQEQQRQGR